MVNVIKFHTPCANPDQTAPEGEKIGQKEMNEVFKILGHLPYYTLSPEESWKLPYSWYKTDTPEQTR